MERNKIRALTYISLCVAIMSVVSQIAIPIGAVPFTLQVFVIALIGYFLGVKKGSVAVVTYILLGLVGVPVFASFQGGAHTLIGYTGGFIFGYLPFALMCGIPGGKWSKILCGAAGLFVCHLCGIVQYMLLSKLSFGISFMVVSLPYLLKDIALVLCAYFVSCTLHRKLRY